MNACASANTAAKVCFRDRLTPAERARKAGLAASKSDRTRGIDPATCDRDYMPAQVEFMMAIQAYKDRTGRLFPTWSEVLQVVESLGYTKSQA